MPEIRNSVLHNMVKNSFVKLRVIDNQALKKKVVKKQSISVMKIGENFVFASPDTYIQFKWTEINVFNDEHSVVNEMKKNKVDNK